MERLNCTIKSLFSCAKRDLARGGTAYDDSRYAGLEIFLTDDYSKGILARICSANREILMALSNRPADDPGKVDEKQYPNMKPELFKKKLKMKQ
ncbi:hypothetical protein FQN55_001329 [Onygenales sp. PD_40]|nr:hypothetical protein FQN55_001329 [Onygenales sp. PD_40]